MAQMNTLILISLQILQLSIQRIKITGLEPKVRQIHQS
jgi:hypothetical protein